MSHDKNQRFGHPAPHVEYRRTVPWSIVIVIVRAGAVAILRTYVVGNVCVGNAAMFFMFRPIAPLSSVVVAVALLLAVLQMLQMD